MKPQVHVSMLTTLAGCGVKFKRRYGARFGLAEVEEIMPPSVSLAVGIAVHSAANRFHLELARTAIDKTAMTFDPRLYAMEEMEKSWTAGLMLTEKEAADAVTVKARSIMKAGACAMAYCMDCVDRPAVKETESKFVIELPDFPFDLAGTMDVIEQNDGICDIKCRGKAPQPTEARSLQMKVYSWAMKILTGKWPPSTEVCCVHMSDKQTSATVTRVLDTPLPSWEADVLARILRFHHLIGAAKQGLEVFQPADPEHPYLCRKEFCGYYATCEFWSGK